MAGLTDGMARLMLRCGAITVIAAGLTATFATSSAGAQEAKKSAPAAAAAGSPVARGQYIVEDVAMCGTCHTPRLPNGQLDRSRWLAGASNPYMAAYPTVDWPTITPRIGGLTPTSDEAMVKLLTTGIWTDGKQLRDPMPKFHMTRADAEAVVTYLKTVTTSH